MPKVPNAKPTRKTVPSTEGLLIGSFIMDHETWTWAKPCIIEGCTHRLGPNKAEPGQWLAEFNPCSDKALPGWAAFDRDGFPQAGAVCACHAAEILERDAP